MGSNRVCYEGDSEFNGRALTRRVQGAMVAPLTRRRIYDGTLYQRPEPIERALEALVLLPRQAILTRLSVRDRAGEGYIPSEVLVHLIRATRTDNDASYFDQLYTEILRRLDRALPSAEETIAEGAQATNAAREQVREEVIARFEDALVEDRAAPGERLDIFECCFDFAVKKARQRAWRRLYTERERRHPLTAEELTEGVETGVAAFASLRSQLFSDPTSRMRLHAAIDLLPEKDRRIIQMLIADFPIDSKIEGEISIRAVLGCDEKTVRNRRDAFIERMRALVAKDARA